VRQSDRARGRSAFEPHIIERPRLMNRLRGSAARTILLIAPAGYGKTILTRQWADAVDAVLLTTTLGSADVAELARRLAAALEPSAPGLFRLVDESVRTMQNPARELDRLDELFTEKLRDAGQIRLAIDDYQVLDGAPAESLVATLARLERVRLLIASRTRPRWITAREAVYGELLELRRSELALDTAESEQVLGDAPGAREILDRADGWPAVIGLVAVAGARGVPPEDALAPTLYDFLAEETFAGAETGTRDALLRLALLPPLSRNAFAAVFGPNAGALETDAARTGLVELSHDAVTLHPLARAFLRERTRATADVSERVSSAIAWCLDNQAWDEAFELVEEFDLRDELELVISASLPSLLRAGLLTRVERLSRHASSCGRHASAVIDLVDAEIAFRDGFLEQAQRLALSSARRLGPHHTLKARSYILAGTAALLRVELHESLAMHSAALKHAISTHDRHDALWGRCFSLISLEDEASIEAERRLGELEDASFDVRLRAATAELLVARLNGGFGRVSVETGVRFLDRASDPRARTSYGNVGAYVLALQGRYIEARALVDRSLEDAKRYRLLFAEPYLLSTKALIELGLRRFSSSDRCLRVVESSPQASEDPQLETNARILRARLLLTQHRVDEAIAIACSPLDFMPTRAIYGEYFATQALCLAVGTQHEAAHRLTADARRLTDVVEVQTITAVAEAVVTLARSKDRLAPFRAFAVSRKLGAWDALVCGLRTSPPLLRVLARENETKACLAKVLTRSRDQKLLNALGLPNTHIPERGGVLSPRERDVIELMGQGLTNAEIASTLYISKATAKAHVQHILHKLRARSRAAAVACYAADDTHSGTASSSDG
jgi:DNA-binding CsgD family transcriptional regulator